MTSKQQVEKRADVTSEVNAQTLLYQCRSPILMVPSLALAPACNLRDVTTIVLTHTVWCVVASNYHVIEAQRDGVSSLVVR